MVVPRTYTMAHGHPAGGQASPQVLSACCQDTGCDGGCIGFGVGGFECDPNYYLASQWPILYGLKNIFVGYFQ